MRSVIKIIAFFLFLTFSEKVCALDTDTTKTPSTSSITRYYTSRQFEYADSANYIDNSLYDFQRYLPKTYLGNTGQVIHDQTYNPFLPELGFNYSKNNAASYFYTPRNLKFYNSRTPYTDLQYITGTQKEQLFKMAFSYNVTKNWNLTANYYNIHSDGVYRNQNTKDNFIAFSTNYKSKNNRYWLLGSICYNSIKTAESGGLIEDSVFNAVIDQDHFLVNLSYAQRTVVNRDIFVKQYFNFGKSLPGDTSGIRPVIPESRFILTTTYDDNYLRYTDSLADMQNGYYPAFYYDSARTHDSTFYRKIENELEWKRADNGKHRGIMDQLGAGLSIRHQLIMLRQRDVDTTFNTIIVGAQLFNTYSRNAFWWNISGSYGLNGYNKNDFMAVAAVHKKLADSLIDITLKGTERSQMADFIYTTEHTNNFIWNNNFLKVRQSGAELSFLLRKYRLQLSAAYNAYTNVLYFDNYAIARQYTATIPVFSLFLKKDFVLYNWHLNNRITYQEVPGSTVIRLPQFIFEHSLYYERELLNKALLLQIGAGIFYNTSYYADGYMPVTGEFYLQNNRKYGDYPFIDVFLCARVKTVKLFFKVDHINSGASGINYMLTPGYLYPYRTFKFGVSWRFYD